MRKGISLVALVITIVVLIILTAIIMIMFNEGGIFGKAEESAFKSDFSNILDSFMLYKNELMLERFGNVDNIETENEEEIKGNIPILRDNNKIINNHKYTDLIQIYDGKIYQSYDISNSEDEKDKEISRWLSEVGIDKLKELISKEDDYVGYYADIDADGTVDGIIYADLLHGVTGQWTNEYGTFSYSSISSSSVKKYYVSQKNYSGPFEKEGETKEVISPIGNGEERFYVMALNNIDNEKHWWYYKANNMTDYETATSVDFGTGRDNTETMMEKWNNKSYGEQSNQSPRDLWGLISTQVSNGWFLPSRGELATYRYNLERKSTNSDIWTSSQRDNRHVWKTYSGVIQPAGDSTTGNIAYVRLSTTF